jgi:hypothetical protein
MAELVIVSGPAGSGKTRWATERAKAGGWSMAFGLADASRLLSSGVNVVLDPDGLNGHKIYIREFKEEKMHDA